MGIISSALATPDKNANCRSCHDDITTRKGMYLSNYQRLTNVGPNTVPVFRVTPGAAASIHIEVTNLYSGAFGLSLLNLNVAGTNSATNRLIYAGDPNWANRNKSGVNWFTVGPLTEALGPKTNHLFIATNTPSDFYLVQMQMAGMDGDGFRWSQIENFYLDVTTPSPAPPTLVEPTLSGGHFSARVATSIGFTYTLEYKASLTATNWITAAQTSGDGASKTLIHSNAPGSEGFYRIRVE